MTEVGGELPVMEISVPRAARGAPASAKSSVEPALPPHAVPSKARTAEGEASAFQYEKLKVELRESMGCPHVENAALKDFLTGMYRKDATIGSGSTAAAYRKEKRTGESVRGKFHEQKVADGIKFLERWIRKNPTAYPGDRAAAENVLKDLREARK